MSTERRRAWTVLTVLVMGAALLRAQSPGSNISGSAAGVVVDETGKPIPEATVFALPEMEMTKEIRAQADEFGRFHLTGLPPGEVFVDAFKESAGYPYCFFSFFKTPNAKTPVKVKIVPGGLVSNVVLEIGPKAAYLEFSITDENDAAMKGTLLFDRADIPGPYQRSVESGEKVMVPAVPFQLTFQANGYLPWHYSKVTQAIPGNSIDLKPGESMKVFIHPRRSASQAVLPDK
ncbi:carboxypeptidase regulatory-like domain-containing protein [Acidobacteria bacterium AB60]|nr:carboxypeptidase regulatory-like domain-containing protein [Acidobacteria bacterium AB60]